MQEDYSYELSIDTEHLFFFPDIVARIGKMLVSEYYEDLRDIFPFDRRWIAECSIENEQILFSIEFVFGTGVLSGGGLTEETRNALMPLTRKRKEWKFDELFENLGEKFYSPSKFTYVGLIENGMASSDHIATHIAAWFESIILEYVININQSRVYRVIPPSPMFDVNIFKDIWVLECDEQAQQGTAFMLNGIGLVTCAHVIGSHTQAFRASSHHIKYDTEVVKSNKVIDLAILRIMGAPEADLRGGLERGDASNLKNFDHIAVAGFPNFNFGDSGRLVPGLIVGTRIISGVRRFLTNASIIAGNSGGPVINSENQVVGVAATGADSMDVADQTEKHGFIQIDAIDILA